VPKNQARNIPGAVLETGLLDPVRVVGTRRMKFRLCDSGRDGKDDRTNDESGCPQPTPGVSSVFYAYGRSSAICGIMILPFLNRYGPRDFLRWMDLADWVAGPSGCVDWNGEAVGAKPILLLSAGGLAPDHHLGTTRCEQFVKEGSACSQNRLVSEISWK
jgi:hypothetical protein